MWFILLDIVYSLFVRPLFLFRWLPLGIGDAIHSLHYKTVTKLCPPLSDPTEMIFFITKYIRAGNPKASAFISIMGEKDSACWCDLPDNKSKMAFLEKLILDVHGISLVHDVKYNKKKINKVSPVEFKPFTIDDWHDQLEQLINKN